ncbi:hypothetical protein ACH3VR_04350 [Microbacterium sp. B2969]|uniref:DUF7882 domain-containing protein n=1 Tax=Microbacterium alkaliflavum TaxID=3248839 RepID=A0ABW7Q417_9MICO
MGTLYYGSNPAPIQMCDRLLAHLKVVVSTKLRRGEAFTVTWVHSDLQPSGRTTIWVQSAIPLRFVFDSDEPAQIDVRTLETLVDAANQGNISLSSDDLTALERP